MLERNIAIAPTLPRVVQLAALYQQEHQTGKELALLAQFEADLTVESGLLLRLAKLQADTGDRDGAIRVLMRKEIVGPPAPSAHIDDERLLLAELLVASGRSAEAVRLGKEWILQWRQPWLADRLLRAVALKAPVADASELGDAVAVLHPELRFFLVRELAQMGAVPVARHLLESWSAANPSPSMNEIAAFLSACRDHDEPAIVWQAFGEVLRRPSADDDLIAHFSEAIAAEFGIGALAPFWSSLPQSVIQHRPLLAAQLAFHEHDLGTTRWLLASVDLARLGNPERQMWLDLLTAVASPPEVFVILRERRRGGQLSPDLLARYARLAGELGEDTEYRAALADLRRKLD